MKKLRVVNDGNGNTAFGLNFSTYVDTQVLAAGVAEVYTVPTRAKYVLFSSTVDFYARPNAAAAVPTTEIADGTGSVLSPTLRSLEGVSTIGLISAEACIVTMEFYT